MNNTYINRVSIDSVPTFMDDIVLEDGTKNNVDNGISIKGFTFVFTGPAVAGGRAHLTEVVEKAGGYVAGAINSSVAYLVTDTPDSGSAKNRKADQLGIKKITSTQLT